MNKITSILILLLSTVTAVAQGIIDSTVNKLSSPDGKYSLTFYQRSYKNGVTRMFYTLNYDSKPVISESELGVDIDNKLFESALGIPNDTCRWGDNLKVTGVKTTSVNNTWHPVYGENSEITDNYNAFTVCLCKGEDVNAIISDGYDKRRYYYMNVEFRAYNEGVAFRYHFPEATNGLFLHITGERSSFTLPSSTEAWHEGWAQGPYSKITLADWYGESERPLLLQIPSGIYLALGEARMIDYVRGKFDIKAVSRKNAMDNTRTIGISLYSSADITTPYDTPWRVIMAATKATDLINNKDIYLNLNDKCKLKDTSFIRPGKAFRIGTLRKDAITKGIDFAAECGLQYIELDAGWYGPEASVASKATKVADNRDFEIEEVCSLAKSKGLGLWLYVNQRALYNQLDSILPVYKRIGIAGIKFGFVHIGNQQWSTWLHDAVRRCAEYGIMVDIHDEYRPTGFSRTYPNLLTQEGIRGNEEMPDASHNTLLPYTRFLCGPADYTLCYFNNRVKNTKAHQLAMAVVYYSPLQFMYWYDRPEDYHGEKELQLWHDVPTVWDESKALDGVPGEYIVQARRSGNDWYIGAMTNTKARNITINTADFLPKGGNFIAEIYTDDASLKTRTKVKTTAINGIKSGRKLQINLLPSGGAAIHLIKL